MRVIGDHNVVRLTRPGPFDAQAYFTEGQSRFWFFPNFVSVFVSDVRPLLADTRITLCCATVTTDKKEVADSEVFAALPNDSLFMHAEVCLVAAALMDQQMAGEAGLLADDNIFYTSTHVGRILRFSHTSRWHLSAWKQGEVAWKKGDKVWFPAL